jgi:hypothetical protein
MATIQFTRPKEWSSRTRSYGIYLDGNKIGLLKNDTTLSIDVTAGNHLLNAKIDLFGSPEIAIEIKEGETKYVKVSASNYTKWAPLIVIPFLILGLLWKRVFHFNIVLVAYIPIAIYLLYMFTLGRKKYLDLKEF